MKIAILSTSPNYLLRETAEKMGHTATVLNPRKCYMMINPSTKGFDKLYYGDSGEKPDLIKHSDFDVCINRCGSDVQHSVNILTFMHENLGIKLVVEPQGILIASDKGKTLQKLSSASVRVPRTILTKKPVHVDWIIKSLGSESLIIKTLRGSQGKTVAICDSKLSANSVLGFVFNAGLDVLIEEFIESGASDYRVWVVAGEVVSIMKRSATKKGEFKANLSTGGKGEPAELSEEDRAIAIKAAHAIGLQGMAAVDLLKDSKEGKTYVIEVNSCGGEGIIEVTGHNHYENIIQHCEDLCHTRNPKRSKPYRTTDPKKLAEFRRLIRLENHEGRVLQEENLFRKQQLMELLDQ